jgi:N-acetylmuramic acid 6-phosphate etherase
MSLGQLTTEGRNPASVEIDRLSAREIVALMNAEDARVPQAVGRVAEAIAAAIDVITERLGDGGRLVYLGAGTSGRLGVLDAAECPPTFNSPPWQVVGVIAGGVPALTRAVEGAEDDAAAAVVDLQRVELSSADVLVGIATSGRTPYVLGGLQYARQVGAYAIGLACNADAELTAVAQLVIAPVVGPEVLSGSTRLKAGTATKLVLNMLTTGAMVRLGKTYGNLMVDLQTTNQKLTDRARRIVSTVTGLPVEAAAEWLTRSGGDVKTAIVMHQRHVTAEQARRLLAQFRGRLRDTLTSAALPPTEPPPASVAPWVLGIDGGGSKTLVWLSDAHAADAEPRGIGAAGPSNPQSVGWAAALANIDRAVQRAYQSAGAAREPAAAACLAIAGTGRQADQERLLTWCRQQRLASRVQVVHDVQPLLAAGTRAGWGVALVAGTGSFACGRDSQGRMVRAGGWGYLFDDEGSGYDLVRQGLHAVACAVDGRGPGTRLVADFQHALNVAQPAEIVPAVYARAEDRPWLAALAPVVLEAASAGDDVAQQLVEQAADRLAGLVAAVRRQLPEPVHDLALSGGLLLRADGLRNRLLRRLAADWPDCQHVGIVPQPVVGAVQLARHLWASVSAP